MTTEDVPAWTVLQSRATNREIKFNPIDAQRAMNACVDLIGTLRAVQSPMNAGKADGVNDLRDFAGPYDEFSSGRRWSEVFSAVGKDFNDIVTAHINIVTTMGETFRAAALAFGRAEEQSEDEFRRTETYLRDTKMPTEATPGILYSPKVSNDDVPKKYPGSLKVSDDYDTPTGERIVEPETPDSRSWSNLFNLGQSIFSTTALVAAADWKWMKDQLDAAFEKFRTDIAQTKNGWDSESGEAARKAVDKYVEDTKPLTGKMEDVRQSLLNAAGWLQQTRKQMPTTSTPVLHENGRSGGEIRWVAEYKGQPDYQSTNTDEVKCVEYVLKQYRNEYKNLYVAGIVEYNDSRVALPSPSSVVGTPPVVQPPVSPGTNPDGTPSNGNGIPSNGNGTPNSGAPTPDTPTVPEVTQPQEPAPTEQQPQTPQNQNPSNTTDTTVTQLASTAATLVQTLAQQGATLIQQGLETAQTTVQKATEEAAKLAALQLQTVTPTPTTPDSPTSPKAGVPSGGSPSGGTPNTSPLRDSPQSRLFPRASVATADETVVARAGLASGTTATGTGMTGTPMGTPMGSAAQGAGAGGKESKRPDYLRSGEGMGEVFDQIPAAVTPVAEK